MVAIVNGVRIRSGGREGTTTHGMARTSEYGVPVEGASAYRLRRFVAALAAVAHA